MGYLRKNHKPSPAMIVALIALFIGLSGGAYATVALNQVRSVHIKNGEVKRADIANNAINSAKVANGSLGVADLSTAAQAALKGAKGDPGQPSSATLATTGRITIAHAAFDTSDSTDVRAGFNGCVRSNGPGLVLVASVPLPVGVTITGFRGWVSDTVATDHLLELRRTTDNVVALGSASSTGNAGLQFVEAMLATPELVDAGEFFFFRFVQGQGGAGVLICGAEVLYSIPANTSLL